MHRLRLFAWILFWLVAPPAVIWAMLVLVWFVPFPVWFRLLLIACWAVLLAGLSWRHRALLPLAVVGGLLAVGVLRAVQIPMRSGTPSLLHEFRPYASLEGHTACIQQVRDARYRTDGRAEVRWRRAYYDLDALTGVDLVVIRRPLKAGGTEAFLSFAFADGRHLAIAFVPELRLGGTYRPLAGLFRAYLLRAVAAEERDLFTRAARAPETTVHLLPLDTVHRERIRLLHHVLGRLNGLRIAPEFHHTLDNDGAASVARALARVGAEDPSRHTGLLLPTPITEIARAAGLLAAEGELPQILAAHRIDTQIHAAPPLDPVAWSAWIRGRG